MTLDVQKSLASYITADVTESVAEALTKLRRADKDFILITQKWNEQTVPMSVLREPALMGIAVQQDQKLDQLLDRLPPILTLGVNELDDDYLSEVLTILGETGSPGLVVHLPDNTLGIVSTRVVARAVLPTSARNVVSLDKLVSPHAPISVVSVDRRDEGDSG